MHHVRYFRKVKAKSRGKETLVLGETRLNQTNRTRHLVGSKCYEATAVQLIVVYSDEDSAPHQLNLKILVLKVR